LASVLYRRATPSRTGRGYGVQHRQIKRLSTFLSFSESAARLPQSEARILRNVSLWPTTLREPVLDSLHSHGHSQSSTLNPYIYVGKCRSHEYLYIQLCCSHDQTIEFQCLRLFHMTMACEVSMGSSDVPVLVLVEYGCTATATTFRCWHSSREALHLDAPLGVILDSRISLGYVPCGSCYVVLDVELHTLRKNIHWQ